MTSNHFSNAPLKYFKDKKSQRNLAKVIGLHKRQVQEIKELNKEK